MKLEVGIKPTVSPLYPGVQSPEGETVFSSFGIKAHFCLASSPLGDQVLQSCSNNGPSDLCVLEAKLSIVQLEDAAMGSRR